LKRLKNSTITKIAIVISLVLIYMFVPAVNETINSAASVFKNLNVDDVREYILSFGPLAPIVSFLLMVFQSVAAPLPAFLITFANANLFGWIAGAALSWTSAMAGAIVCFFIARYFGREVVEKLTTKAALSSVDVFFEKYGKYAILVARLLPFVSFDIVSYAAGLTSMSFWSFIWATGLGQLPATLVYSYVGGMLSGGTKLFVTGLLVLFSLSVIIFMVKKIWSEKNAKAEGNR
jgi:uncharacterized membrane protein YdjX (TVP38/TMEM64 family)